VAKYIGIHFTFFSANIDMAGSTNPPSNLEVNRGNQIETDPIRGRFFYT
jgi:hypothetical protein